MYAYIKGRLEEVYEDRIVVETHGIGYQIFVSVSLTEQLPPIGELVKIYTYLHVKEDAFTLFGFLTREEHKIFKMMLNVSGIGPKGALGILSVMAPERLCAAVANDDAKAIAKAPGIGSKTAQKLIIELKDKIKLDEILTNGFVQEDTREEDSCAPLIQEAIEALVALGYSQKEAKNAVSKLDVKDGMTVEDMLKAALRNMAFI